MEGDKRPNYSYERGFDQTGQGLPRVGNESLTASSASPSHVPLPSSLSEDTAGCPFLSVLSVPSLLFPDFDLKPTLE